VYLQQIKAHAWLGLVQLKKEGKMQETLLTSQNYEGESAAIHYFLNKLNLNGYLTFSLRQIYDIRQRFPEDTVILLIEQSLLKFLAKTDKFNLSDYSNLNFHESSEARTKALSEHAPKTSASDTVALTKYEKIHSKRNVNTPENFDSTKYYLYDLSDIIADSLFCAKFHSYRKSYNEYKSELATTKQSAKGWNGPDHTESQNELHNLLVLTPVSSCEHQKKGPLWTKKDACEKYMWLALTETARKTKVSTTQIEKTDKSTESSGLNHRGLVYSLVEQSSINTDAEIVPVDFHLLKAIELQTGSSNVLISYSNYYYEPKLNGLFFLACIVCPPFLFYIPVAAVQAHELSTSVLVLELTTGKVNSSAYLYKHGQPSKQRFLKVYKEVFKKMVTTN